MKAIDAVERFYGDIWNRGDLGAADALCHPDMTFRGSLGQAKTGVAEFLESVKYVRGGLESYQCVIQEAVAQADRVFVKMLFRGVHSGPFEGVEPTGAHVEWQGAALFEFEDGRIRDLWVLGDMRWLHLQLEEASSAQHAERPSAAADRRRG